MKPQCRDHFKNRTDTKVRPKMNFQIETVDGEPYLPGAAALLEQLDKQVLIILRDGRHLVGRLRSFDQFLNLVLDDTCERVIVSSKHPKNLLLLCYFD